MHHKHVRHNEDTNCIILLQRKVNLFCQLTVFLCGNALYSVGKNKAILQLLFRMLSHWNEINLDIPFMLEVFSFLDSYCKVFADNDIPCRALKKFA